MKKNYRDLLALGFIGILYVFAIMKIIVLPMHVPVKNWQFFLFAAGAFLFITLVNTRPGSIVFFSVSGLAILYAAFVLISNGTDGLTNTFAPVIRLGQMIIRIGSGYYDSSVPDTMLMWTMAIFALVLAIPGYYFLVHRFKFYLLIIPGLVLFMVLWGMFRYVEPLPVYIFITIAIVCFIQHKYIQYRKLNGEEKTSAFNANILVFFIPVALVVIFFASGFKVNDLPIQWPWMDEKINKLYWDIYERFDIDRYDNFSLSQTGFGDPSRLGGPIRQDYTPVMVVKAPTRVYLRGAVYDQYTGLGWETSEELEQEYNDDRFMDFQELRYGWKVIAVTNGIHSMEDFNEYLLSGSAPNSDDISYGGYLEFLRQQQMPWLLNRLFPEEEMTVRHLNVRTKTLFTPLKTFEPISGLINQGYSLQEGFGGVFQADRRLAGESQYSFNYLQPAYGMTAMDLYFNLAAPKTYYRYHSNNEELLENLEKSNIPDATSVRDEIQSLLKVYDDLEDHAERIYELYTKIPEGVPERVLNMAIGLTERSGESLYEKVKLLEDFLRSNYTYTLTPQRPPEDRDFVDYFLFDGKEGYCTYFATAMCIMTRALGIPARYVEGFVMPEKPDENGFYHVTNQNAHAWVEVYFEGIGWVTFEPTAPYAEAMNYTVSLTNTIVDGDAVPILPEIFDPSQYTQMGNLPTINLPVYEKKQIATATILIWAGCAILAIMLLNLLAVMIRRLSFRMMSPGKSIPLVYKYIVSLLKQAGCAVKSGETPRDFAERVDKRFKFAQMSMSDVVDLFYRVRFGAQTPDKASRDRLLAFVREAKTKSGRAMYLYKRVLLRGLLFRG